MADFLAHKIADDIYQWLQESVPSVSASIERTQTELGNKIAETINLIRQQQPNELRPRADLPCFLKHTDDIPVGEHRWCKPLEPTVKVERCICGAIRLPEDGFPG